MTETPCRPLSDAEWPDELVDLRDGFAGKLNVYRVMAHHPDLLRAWAPLRKHIVLDSALGAELSEVVILRVGYRMGSEYEWAHHVSRARRLGFDDDRILAIQKVPQGVDGLIVRAVDELLDSRRLQSNTEEELADSLGRKAVFDLIATTGFYSVLGYLLMSYNTPMDEDIADELRERPLSLTR